MSNSLLKKATSVIAGSAIVLSVVSPVTGASANSTYIEAANKLAAANVIVDNSGDTSKYNLGNTITRREMLKIMMNLSSVDVENTCEGKFSDLGASDWGCKYAESALEAGFIAANAKFRPDDNVSKIEALKMIFQAEGIERAENEDWRAGYVETAVELGISDSLSDYDTPAKRSMVFVSASNAMDSSESTETESSTEDEATTEEGDDLGDLLGSLFGDEETTSEETTSEETTSDETTSEETTDTVVSAEGDVLEVTLSPETPASSDLPSDADGVLVAAFDLTAGEEDVEVTAFTFIREGLARTAIGSVAVFSDDMRISKAKSFNSSDDDAYVNLESTLVIEAGSTETIYVRGLLANTGKFSVSLTEVVATSEVEIAWATSEEHEGVGTEASDVTIESNGDVSNPKIGEEAAEILKFKIENEENNEEITVSEITIKELGTIDEEDELANFVLTNDGDEIASVASMDSKYLTFKLDTPVVIGESKTEKFVVTADILGGASKTINFELNSTLDLIATSTKVGFVDVTEGTSLDSESASILAGEINLDAVDPTITKIRQDKDDVILGKVTVDVNGNEVELQAVQFVLDVTAGSLAASDIFDSTSFELYDETNGLVYDLDATASDVNDDMGGVANEDYTLANSDVDVILNETTTFVVRADTNDSLTAAFANSTMNLSLDLDSDNDNDIDSSDVGFRMVETQDDTVIDDVTPSSISYKTIDGSASSATITVLPLSASKNAVIGSSEVVALEFEVEADESSALTVDEIIIDGQAATATLNNSLVTEVKLYQNEVSEANLLDRVSGSSIASEKATFDWFDVEIAANGKETFVVTVSLVDDSNNNGDDINLAIDSDGTNLEVSMEDEDEDTVVYADATDEASARTITVVGAGSLKVTVDTTDSEVDKTKNILANTTSAFVASYELTATNESILVQDFTLTDSDGSLEDYVSEVIVYESDKTTEISRETVTSSTVEFENVNYVVEEGTTNLYVKVVTRKIGKDEAGNQSGNLTFDLTITDAEGNESNKDLAAASDGDAVVESQEIGYDSNSDGTFNAAETDSGESLSYSVLPIKVSAVSFVSSYGGTSVSSSLNSGENTLAILALTTDSNTNTDTNGGELKTALSNITVNISKLAGADATDSTTLTSISIERVNGNDSDGVSADAIATVNTSAGTDDDISFTMSNLTSDDNILENGSTTYFAIKATVVKATNADIQDYAKVEFTDLDNTDNGITYAADDNGISGYANVTEARIGVNTLEASQIND